MESIRARVVGIILLFNAALGIGCGASPDAATRDLVGRWTRAESEGPGVVDFEPDGRFALTDASGGTVAGTWEATGDGSLTMTITHSNIMRDRLEAVEPETLVVEAETQGGMLRLSSNGETEIYRRNPDGD